MGVRDSESCTVDLLVIGGGINARESRGTAGRDVRDDLGSPGVTRWAHGGSPYRPGWQDSIGGKGYDCGAERGAGRGAVGFEIHTLLAGRACIDDPGGEHFGAGLHLRWRSSIRSSTPSGLVPFEEDYTLLGTTDVEIDGEPGPVAITAEEIDYICTVANGYFETPLSPGDQEGAAHAGPGAAV